MKSSVTTAISCLTCEYSELTMGSPTSVACAMERKSDCPFGRFNGALRTTAMFCPYYETNHEIATPSDHHVTR